MNATFLAMVPTDFITHVEKRFKVGIITESRKNKILKEFNSSMPSDGRGTKKMLEAGGSSTDVERGDSLNGENEVLVFTTDDTSDEKEESGCKGGPRFRFVIAIIVIIVVIVNLLRLNSLS